MIPPELPPAFAKITSLGPVEAVYRSSMPSMKRKFVAWLIATAIVGAIFAVGYFGQATLKAQDMEMVAIGAQMLGLFGLVIIGGVWLLLLLGMWLLNLVLFAKPQVIAVYRDGVANSDKGKLCAWEWPDVREIYAYFFADTVTSDTGVGSRFDIVHKDGSRFTISHVVAGWDELIARLRREVYARVGPEITRAADAGQPIPFGKDLIVEREGVRVAKKLTPWEALHGYRVERGLLLLQVHKSSPAQVPVGSIPNLELLLALLGEKIPKAG
jgi:hypothetical protein